MADYFALLGEVRRPCPDMEVVEEKFLRLSADTHPDRVHAAKEEDRHTANERYTEINAAYQCVRDTKARLRHLLELELGRKPVEIEEMPPEMVDLFIEVGQRCQEVDKFLEEKERVSSPLLRAKLFEQSIAWNACLTELQAKVRREQEKIDEQLQQMDKAWVGAPAVDSEDRASQLPLNQLEELYRRCSYFDRWQRQLQARFVRLAI